MKPGEDLFQKGCVVDVRGCGRLVGLQICTPSRFVEPALMFLLSSKEFKVHLGTL